MHLCEFKAGLVYKASPGLPRLYRETLPQTNNQINKNKKPVLPSPQKKPITSANLSLVRESKKVARWKGAKKYRRARTLILDLSGQREWPEGVTAKPSDRVSVHKPLEPVHQRPGGHDHC